MKARVDMIFLAGFIVCLPFSIVITIRSVGDFSYLHWMTYPFWGATVFTGLLTFSPKFRKVIMREKQDSKT